MKKSITRLLAAVLSTTFLITTVGCSSKEKDKEKGRYVEERYDIGNDINVQNVIKLKDGSLSMVGGRYTGEAPEYLMLKSQDHGKTWSEESLNIPSEEGKFTAIDNMLQFKDGRIFISYYFEKPLTEEEIAEMDKEDFEYKMPEFKYGIIDTEGNLQEIKMDLSQDLASEKGGYIQSFKASENGDIFYIAGENMNELVQIDGESFEEKHRYEADEYIENYLLMGEDLIIINYNGIVKYDIESGEEKGNLEALEKETIKSKSNYYPSIINSDSKDKIYYYSALGLYAYDMKTEKTKMLVDGSISSFGNTSMDLMALFETENDNFLAVINDWSSNTSSTCIVNYTYDAKIPTVPDNQIVVYSLIENDGIRQAISSYLKNHQDTYIKYEVGLTWDNGITEADALKTLNTEIMSGKGPDIILLDGLSADSYIKDGLLEDISDVIKEYTKNDELLSNIVEAYTVDGKIYQIPTKISIPMILGNKDKISKITDLNSLTEVAKELQKENDNRIFDYFTAKSLVYGMYYLYGTDWLNDDNTINEEALSSFMNNSKELYKVVSEQQEKYDKKMEELWSEDENTIEDGTVAIPDEEVVDDKESYEDENGEDFNEEVDDLYELSYSLAPYGNYSGYIYDEYPSNLTFGGIRQSYDFQSLITAMYTDKNLDYKVLTSGEDKIFYPISNYGINSNSKNKKIAKDFIKELLSEKVQGNNNGWSEGLPVNKVAFKKIFEITDEYKEYYKFDETTKHYMSEYTMSTMNGEEKKMVEVLPNEDDVNKYLGEVEKANVAPKLNKVLLIEVAKQFEAYVNDECTVEDAVKKIVDNLDLYLAE